MKKMILISSALLLLFGLSLGTIAMADDDYDQEENGDWEFERSGEGEGEHEEEYEHESDDDDDDERYEYNSNNQITEYNQYREAEQTGYWNIWTREVINNSTTELPITVPSEISLKIEDQQTTIYAVPRDGQLLISAKDLAKKLGANVKVYTESNIVKVTKGKNELIVRVGSNAAYENNTKTPMPVEAVYYEKSIYIPICVLANALGYRLDWIENEKNINFVNVQ